MNRFLLMLGCYALSTSLFAGALPVLPPVVEKTPYFELLGGIGVLTELEAKNSILQLSNSEFDTLVQTDNEHPATVTLGLGYVYPLHFFAPDPEGIAWFPAIEPEINVYAFTSTIHGDVFRFETSDFNQFTYEMPVWNARLMLDAALTVVSWRQFSAYAIAGFGKSWERLGYSDLQNTDVNCPLIDVQFDDTTSTNLVGEVGAGLSYNISPDLQLTFQYLYADLGTADAGQNDDVLSIPQEVIVPAGVDIRTQALFLGVHWAIV